jgi:hypothetical protein
MRKLDPWETGQPEQIGQVNSQPAKKVEHTTTPSLGIGFLPPVPDVNFVHGHSRGKGSAGKSPTYQSWLHMRERCNNSNVRNYKWYGGRGITYCHRWNIFVNFLHDMGKRPYGKTLDRVATDGNYEKSNCRWATPSQQAYNRRSTVNI